MTKRDAINLLEEIKILDDTMYAYNPNYLEALDMALTALKAEETLTATHECSLKTQWIPCSKKLPEKIEKDYWVCTDRHGWQCQCKWRKFPSQRGDFWAWNTMARVVAWMPLPEPYQESEQE